MEVDQWSGRSPASRTGLSLRPTCLSSARWLPSGDAAIRQLRRLSMVVRRNFIVGIATSLICAPAVVHASSLMPIRMPPYEAAVWGQITRLYVHTYLPTIMKLQADGLSQAAIAGVLNLKGSAAMNGVPWNASNVQSVIGLDRRIRFDDAIFRVQREKAEREGRV